MSHIAPVSPTSNFDSSREQEHGIDLNLDNFHNRAFLGVKFNAIW
jgi:hypothetical protein